MELIDKEAVLSEIRMYKDSLCDRNGNLENVEENDAVYDTLSDLEGTIDSLEVMNEPYERTIQSDSIKAGIQAHAETYSFNIESKLFNQLTKEQQELWRKELEQACISGGEVGVELARDPRYKEDQPEVKEELSVEEKAKRYDESIERAKDYVEKQNPPVDVLYKVFPELKESEHERIRKELIQYLKDYPTNLPNGQYCRDDFFRWLEKQKEQEPTTQPVWSEEDEKLYKLSFENLAEFMHRFGEEYGKSGDCIDWFKSIKDRFFQKCK